MEEMEKRERYFKKAKFWTMFLLVIKIIGSITGVLGLPSAINPTKQIDKLKQSMTAIDDQQFAATMQKTIDMTANPFYRGYIVITLIISVALVVLFFLANKKLANQEEQTKSPYYLYLGMIVVGLIVSLLSGSLSFANPLVVFASIFGLVWQLLLTIPAILALVNLFKLESN